MSISKQLFLAVIAIALIPATFRLVLLSDNLLWSIWAASVVALIGGIYCCRKASVFNSQARFSPKGDFDNEPALWTLNGCGTRFCGVSGNPYVKYQFFCLLYMPIIPLGCYGATSEGEGYSWYGYAEWNLLEVVGIYLRNWGGLMTAMFTIYNIYGLFQ